ncbi:hypothetical protein MBH78_10760 [Oceanimonas sp. NS1]|nr:hypothetical protein [Oceanimonas sp. NS1]
MKVRLEKALELELLTEVQLSLPELSKLGRDWKLKRLRYRVINQSGDGHVLHLQAEPAGKTTPAAASSPPCWPRTRTSCAPAPRPCNTPPGYGC